MSATILTVKERPHVPLEAEVLSPDILAPLDNAGVRALPVILGTIGGIGLVIGPAGLLVEKFQRDPALTDQARLGMDTAFIVMLFLSGLTGLALLVLRDTAAMGLLLAVHLGVVFALFLTLPYGKFVHGLYRFLALVRYAGERRAMAGAHSE